MAKSNKQPAYLPPPKTTKTVKGQKYSGSRTKEGKSNNGTTTTNGNTLSTSGPINGDASTGGGGGNRGGSGSGGGVYNLTGNARAGNSATPFNFNQEADLPQYIQEEEEPLGHG